MSKKNLPQEVYGKKYLVKNGRKLPIYKSLISVNDGLVSIIVVRRLPNGNFVVGNFLIDRFCLGLKSTSYKVDLSMSDYTDFIDEISFNLGLLQECTYATAHNWIYGGIAYAEDLGFKPDSDFNISKYILEDDTEDIELIEFEFGRNGKPYFFQGPYDNARSVLETLRKSVGEGNFEYATMY
ncbi:hypothetical protein VB264_12135 [Arcicella aquatica]|uniref:Immunity protein 26 of polymorphic toxin system n=1 Tax=Arcicella aquatica TaxID=217141 RepID=A0ABU5QP22_9BACT|nr:hypothetical protein [Arcicella aquatica]MEA5258535.1 hypothetical protein [Arcicella aquatica]